MDTRISLINHLNDHFGWRLDVGLCGMYGISCLVRCIDQMVKEGGLSLIDSQDESCARP